MRLSESKYCYLTQEGKRCAALIVLLCCILRLAQAWPPRRQHGCRLCTLPSASSAFYESIQPPGLKKMG